MPSVEYLIAITLAAVGAVFFATFLTLAVVQCLREYRQARRRARHGGDIDLVELCRPRDRRLP